MASRVQQLQLAPEQVQVWRRLVRQMLDSLEVQEEDALYQQQEAEYQARVRRQLKGELERFLHWLDTIGSSVGAGSEPKHAAAPPRVRPKRLLVQTKERPVLLTPKTYKLWNLFTSSPGVWWSAEDLGKKLSTNERHAVIQLISRLRKALEPSGLKTMIETRRGKLGLAWRWRVKRKLGEELGSKQHAVTQLICRLRQQPHPIHLDTRIETERGSGWRCGA